MAQLFQSKSLSERTDKIETAMKKQATVLDQLQTKKEVHRPDDSGFTEQRLKALELASSCQSVIQNEHNDAVHDVGLDSTNNGARIRMLELVVTKQKR